MSPIFPCFFILLVHLFSLVLPSHNNVDHVALLAIKSQIISDPHGVLNSWNNSLPICQWYGVSCGKKHPQRVVGLELKSQDLVGTLSPYVGNLSFLQKIQLFNNTFRGHIPAQIGNLYRLKFLGLEENTFQGQIPANLSRCFDLKDLGLAGNNLNGTIPSQLSLLSKLEFLTLQTNRLMGDLLNTVLINMTSMQILSASANSFHGTIPDNIGAVLKDLEYFALDENNISGTIPPSFYNLSNLQVVSLTFNQLQGTLPSDFGFGFPQLLTFQIASNFLHGNLPPSLSNLTRLERLSVYSNNFTGKLVFSARNMPNLYFVDVSLNHLGKGEPDDLNFVQTLVNCTQLRFLTFGFNNFSGILPNSLGNLSTSITGVDFGQNHIYGSIQLGLFNLVNLRILILEENYLTGQIPPQIDKLTKLETFSCRRNYLNGSIPYSIGKLSRLSILCLNSNNFQDIIPSSLGQCTNLLELSLSQNNFSGNLPPQLFHASSMLVKLSLDHNHLQGTIPVEIEHLSNVVGLDLSENLFSGELPTSLSSCTGLVNLDMGGNLFIGSIPQSYKSLSSMRTLNFSHNKLSGPIPNYLANFSLMELDLSSNNFEGEVPREGIFANLSGLTLSGNIRLCGGVHELHLPRCPAKSKSSRRGGLSVAVIVVIAVACLVVGVSIASAIYFLCFRKKQEKPSQMPSSNLNDPFWRISYDMLMKATDGFSEANLVGVGRFSSVYKGVLDLTSNMVVAIKVISLEQKGASKSFMRECEALRNIRHRNLLKIVTVCSSTDFQGNDFKALVYEFMPNGCLHQWIHHERTLSLLQRVNIAIDVASALDYLHNRCDVSVIHCDLKPSNILLDDDMVTHVGDFGLARFCLPTTPNTSSSVAVKGTVGYAAPEYGYGSMVSKEGDMYSYGIVLIEMMTAKNPIDSMFKDGLDLHQFAKSALSDELLRIIDPRLLDDNNDFHGIRVGKNSSAFDCTRSLIEIGVKCSVVSPKDRMRIEDVIEELQVTRNILKTCIIRTMQI